MSLSVTNLLHSSDIGHSKASTLDKGHSCSPCPQKNFHNFSLEGQQSFYLHHLIILPVLFCVCQISIHCFIVKLQYNHVLIL